MAQLSDLLKRPVEGEVDWCGVLVKFTANRAAHTHSYEKQLRQACAKAQSDGEEASIHEFYARSLPPLLMAWDLEDDGEPVPLTEDALLGLPAPFLQALSEAIRDANAPFATAPKPDASGSFS